MMFVNGWSVYWKNTVLLCFDIYVVILLMGLVSTLNILKTEFLMFLTSGVALILVGGWQEQTKKENCKGLLKSLFRGLLKASKRSSKGLVKLFECRLKVF